MKWLLILSCITLMYSCKKEKEPRIVTVKGKIRYNCNDTANYASKLTLIQYTGYLFDDKSIYETTTESDGSFTIEYPLDNGAEFFLKIDGVETYGNIPKKDIDFGTINMYGYINYKLNLNVTNSYTQNDTLLVGDLNYYGPNSTGNQWLKIPGPFVSGTIDTVVNSLFIYYPITYGLPANANFTYQLPNGTWKKMKFEPTLCSDDYQTITIDVH